jgi:hypothetical protein
VIEVNALPNYRLSVRFTDGTRGEVDLSQLIKSENAGVFAELKDPCLFTKVYLEYGVVMWPGEIDLAPDAMYDAIKQKGKWILD